MNQLNSTTDCEKYSLYHIEATSESNTLHYLWDFTAIPSVLMALTSKNSSLYVDYKNFSGNYQSINFSVAPEYVLSSVIRQLYVFNDTKDEGNVSDHSNTDFIVFDPLKMTWKNLTMYAGNNEIFALVNASTPNNGSFSIKVSIIN